MIKGMQTFKWNAVDYSKNSSVQQQWARELIYKLDLKGNEIILDIGSGDGKVTAEIASHLTGGSIIGIDNSEDMIKLARDLFSQDAFSNLRFQLADAKSLNFENEFDIVFSNATLHWIYDHRPVLKGIYRSLKHGGRILLQMGGRGNAREVMDALAGLMKKEEWLKYFKGFGFSYGFFDPNEYSLWLHEAGFFINRVELIPKDAVHQGIAGFKSWFRTTWLPYIQQVPEDKKEFFISQLADEYLRLHPADRNGDVHVNMMRLEVEALKL